MLHLGSQAAGFMGFTDFERYSGLSMQRSPIENFPGLFFPFFQTDDPPYPFTRHMGIANEITDSFRVPKYFSIRFLRCFSTHTSMIDRSETVNYSRLPH